MSDALFDGRRFRAVTMVDPFTRERLAITVDQALKADTVVATVERLTYLRGKAPGKMRVSNDPEFVSRVLDHWAYQRGATLDFSRPGKPTDNAFVESFNGRLRNECLSTHCFLSLDDARGKIEARRRD